MVTMVMTATTAVTAMMMNVGDLAGHWLAQPQLWLSCLASLLTFLLVRQQLVALSYWSARGIPGPRPWPFLGTSIYYILRPRIQVDKEWREKYGRVYGIYEGLDPVLRVTDRELVKLIRVEQAAWFTDRNNKTVYSPFQRRFLLFSRGAHWSNQRSLITPMFTSSRLKKMSRSVFARIDAFRGKLRAKAKEGGVIDFHKKDQTKLLLETIAQAFFSIKLHDDNEGERDADSRSSNFKLGIRETTTISIWRFLLWSLVPRELARLLQFDLFATSKFECLRKLCHSVLEDRLRRQSEAAEKRKGAAKTKSPQDVLQMLLEARISDNPQATKIYKQQDALETHYEGQTLDELERSHLEQVKRGQARLGNYRNFSENEIVAHMTLLLSAGSDVTGIVCSWCIYELARNPHIADKIRREVLDLRSQQLDYDSIMGLETLNMFVSEVLRLYSPILESNRLCTRKEGVWLPIGDKKLHVFYGQTISLPTVELQCDAEYWPDPLKFDITRFAPENKPRILSGSYAPFGLGPRICVGMRLALLMLKSILVRLLLDYDIKPGPSTSCYPPKLLRSAIFQRLEETDFELIPIKAAS